DKEAPTPLTGPWKCELCETQVQTRAAMKRHGIDKHFYKSLQEDGGVPNRRPFLCSQVPGPLTRGLWISGIFSV
ncbi:MAG: hypothetical protein ACK56I_19175, partial [bacterium]